MTNSAIRRIGIIGGGLAGWCAAGLLADANRQITLYERRPGFREVGAGLTLQPNGLGALKNLAHGDLITASAHRIGTSEVRTLAGDSLGVDVITKLTRGGDSFSIGRRTLLDGLRRSASTVRCEVGVDARAVPDDGHGPGVRKPDGSIARYDLVLCADGWDSESADIINPNRQRVPSPYAAYRAVYDIDPETAAQERGRMRAWMGDGFTILAYPIENDTKMNVVVYDAAAPRRSFPNHRWITPDRLLTLGEAWEADLRHVVASPDRYRRWPLPQVTGIEHIAARGIALIGDAAHPMLPHLGQGANQAFLDARAVSMHVDRDADHLETAYTAERLEEGQSVARMSARFAHLFSSGNTTDPAGHARQILAAFTPEEE